ncbi:hypothetical protein ACFVGY_17430 [Streptomyces sp. NPDC127106]|uniref:hypothetical protein n=1 Tax=Streptomyces sp. NPDC127106 TaxID=3345360 RepID=UPI00363D5012
MMARTAACAAAPLPRSFWDLTIEQARGYACVACGRLLDGDRVYRGVVMGHDGGYLLDADVWACLPEGPA